MTTNFDSIQTLKSREDCDKYSKSVSYETLVAGTATTGRECGEALEIEGVITRRTLVRRGYLPEQGTHANEESLFASVTWLMRLPLRIQRSLRMTIPTLAFLLSLNLSESWAVTCNFTPDPNNEGKYSLEVKGDSGGNVFKGCDNGFPDGISEWSDVSSKITSATLDKNITSIGAGAFYRASSLTSITIPDSVTSIGYAAFRNASSLESITIPDSVKSIGNEAFYGASSLTSITIPDSVTSIGDVAFRYSGLTSITIPEGVTSIGIETFRDISSLGSITIPDSVTSIGTAAFAYASSLESITIPDSVTKIGDAAFAESGLESITIPDSVTSIGSWAFSNASSLKSIIIPDNIDTETWDDWAFGDLPSGIKNIVCQGDLNKCYEKLAKYFSYGDCPQSLIEAGKGNSCSCSNSRYCIDSGLVKEATQEQCGGKYIWNENSTPKCRHMDKDECANSAKYYYNNEQCKSMPGSKTTCKNADFLWSGSSCVKSCASGFVEWKKECLSEYPFAKKRWTPAEANEWLHDGNDNFVVITFKK